MPGLHLGPAEPAGSHANRWLTTLLLDPTETTATPEQVAKLKSDAAIYMVGDSRLNIAGLNQHTVPVLARAIIDAGI